MIYTSARWADEAHTQVIGWDAEGNSETVPWDHRLFRQPLDGPTGFIEAGGVIEDYQAPPEPIPSLEPWQFFAMLDLSGKREPLYAFIEALPEPQKTVAKAKLERSLVFYRDNDLVMAAQDALGLTASELDALWQQAAGLQ